MSRDYIRQDQCPFRVGDRIKDDHDSAGREGVVDHIEEEHIWFTFDDGESGYRVWAHELDTVFKRSGGGLTRITKR